MLIIPGHVLKSRTSLCGLICFAFVYSFVEVFCGASLCVIQSSVISNVVN